MYYLLLTNLPVQVHLVDELTIHKTVPQPSRTEVVETVELNISDDEKEVSVEVVSGN